MLKLFAEMAEVSRAPDDSRQNDGWGITWRERNRWERYVSIKPIWEEKSLFTGFGKTSHYLIHARSSSFEKDKGRVEYNQPYLTQELAFVFNGLIQGVRLPLPLEGRIGAQKVWSLVQYWIKETNGEVEIAIRNTVEDLERYSRKIQALNFSVSDGQRIYVYSHETGFDYYTLFYHRSDQTTMICSEPLGLFDFEPIRSGVVHVLKAS